jgi:hypothetical protein
MSVNLWFDHVIDAYLSACAQGQDWREACIAAEQIAAQRSRRVLTQKALRSEKGIAYSRQHIQKLIRAGKFPKPFQLPDRVK